MIKFFELSKSYGAQVLLDKVSFNINEGEHIGLVGRNGTGKTTLFRMLLGKEDPDEGEVVIPKDYAIGYLEQHLTFTEPTILEEACLGLPPDREYDHWRVEKVLFGLGFTQEDLHRPPSEFSGGFQIRLNLTKTLVSEPDLLLLDEPTNYLDIISIRWLEKFLRAWRREFVLITHDRQFMDSVISHTVGIHRCKVRKIEGQTSKLFNQIMQEEEIYEKTRLHEEKKTKETELFISRFRAKARLAGMVQSRIKSLEKKKKLDQLDKISDVEFSFPDAEFPGQEMLNTEELGFTYDEALPWLIEKLNFSLGPKERIAIIGKNGKGKSTLLRLLADELKPNTGRIRKHNRLEVGYFGQTNIQRLSAENTIEDELICTDPNRSRERARSVAGVMLFSGDQALKKISVLSGGEKSRVMLAKLLLKPTNLLLLDEPTNHLDMESCESLLEAIQDYDGSVMLVTHDEIFLHTLAEKLIIFDRNRVLFYHGRYQNFLDDIGWQNEELQKDVDKPSKRVDPEPVVIQASKEKELSAADKKALKQARAKLVQEKSRTLRPFEAKVKKTETMIEKLEMEIGHNNDLLVEASTTGDASAIAELPKKNKDLQAQVDFLYGDLEKVHHELEIQTKVFEKKLEELEKG